jgi:hypothetical protein
MGCDYNCSCDLSVLVVAIAFAPASSRWMGVSPAVIIAYDWTCGGVHNTGGPFYRCSPSVYFNRSRNNSLPPGMALILPRLFQRGWVLGSHRV